MKRLTALLLAMALLALSGCVAGMLPEERLPQTLLGNAEQPAPNQSLTPEFEQKMQDQDAALQAYMHLMSFESQLQDSYGGACILENNMLQVSVVGDSAVLARYREILQDHLAVVEFRTVRFTLQQLYQLQDALTAKLPQGSWSGIGADQSANCVVVGVPQDIEAVRSIVQADPEFQGMPITYEIRGFAIVT